MESIISDIGSFIGIFFAEIKKFVTEVYRIKISK